MASSSRSWRYDVFPSFSGEDVRKSFLSHLLEKLQRKLIITFIDNGIERSRLIAPELLSAIRESRISIVVFSKKYASSTWCLNELVEIHKCFKEMNQMVIPVFYELDPSDVRKQTGEFGKSFEETCKDKTEDVKQRWIRALAEVASIAGYDSRNWSDEAKIIEQISNDVSNSLFTPSDDFRNFVGIGIHVEGIMDSKLCLESEDVRMVGILGPSGIGKTTIARALYSRLSSHFQYRAFVTSERAAMQDKKDGYSMKLGWAKQLLTEIVGQTNIEIESLGMVEQGLKHSKVLIVLDDVDKIELLETLAERTGWFGLGSRIIVVTQDRALLQSHEIDLIYEVDYPSEELALQMFCQSAFGETSPPDGFMWLAVEVVKLAGNLPLGLNVLGSSLRKKGKEYWAEMMPRLRKGLNGKIQKTLRVGYDGLDEQDDQDLFLYISCLFNGESFNYIKNLLEKSFHTSVNTSLRTLADKSLLRIITPHETVQMHISLEKLGREIVRAESINNPGKRRFLVDAKDISDVFNDNIGTENVLGIHFNTSEIYKPLSIDEKSLEGMRNLQFIKFYKKWRYMLHEVRLPRGLLYLPRKLRLLHWDNYPAKCLPSSFSAEYLVELIMVDSKLEKLWEGAQPCRSLKVINLSGSRDLKEIPDLYNATNLEILNLCKCTSLVTLPSSIRNLKKLIDLIMFGCSNLEVLPTDVNLESLDYLNLSDSSRLRSFPRISRNISRLYLDGTTMEEDDCSWIGNLLGLTLLHWKNCPLRCMPSNFNPEHLVKRDMRDTKLEKLLTGVRLSTSIQKLNLSNTAIDEVPSWIENIVGLTHLWMIGCKKLRKVSATIWNLEHLESADFTDCGGVTSVSDASLVKTVAELHEEMYLSCSDSDIDYFHSDIDYFYSDTEFLFKNCFNLDQDAQKFILQSNFRYAILPGKKVPTYFTHQARGSCLTVPLPQSSLSQNDFEFTACFIPNPAPDFPYPDDNIIIHWKFRSEEDTHKVKFHMESAKLDHLVVLHFSFCYEQDPPSQLDCNNVELEFELHRASRYGWFNLDHNLKTCPIEPWKIKECGVRVLDVSQSLDDNDISSETEYTDQSGERDIETEGSKKRIQMTVVTSQEPSNSLSGQTAMNQGSMALNLDLALGLSGAPPHVSSRSKVYSPLTSSRNFHGNGDGPSLNLSLSPFDPRLEEEAVYFDPMITEQQHTGTPSEEDSSSSQQLNTLFQMTVVPSQENSNSLSGQTAMNQGSMALNLELALGLGEAHPHVSSRSKVYSPLTSSRNFHGNGDGLSLNLSLSPFDLRLEEEAVYSDPMIMEQQQTGTPSEEDTSSSPHLIHFFR